MFNENYLMGIAKIQRFHEAKARHIKHYVLPTLVQEQPKVVLLQFGENDLPTKKADPTPVEKIANEII